jgi:hypothetical protein
MLEAIEQSLPRNAAIDFDGAHYLGRHQRGQSFPVYGSGTRCPMHLEPHGVVQMQADKPSSVGAQPICMGCTPQVGLYLRVAGIVPVAASPRDTTTAIAPLCQSWAPRWAGSNLKHTCLAAGTRPPGCAAARLASLLVECTAGHESRPDRVRSQAGNRAIRTSVQADLRARIRAGFTQVHHHGRCAILTATSMQCRTLAGRRRRRG